MSDRFDEVARKIANTPWQIIENGDFAKHIARILRSEFGQDHTEFGQDHEKLEWIWNNCRLIFYPPPSGISYPLEHSKFAGKDMRLLIEAEMQRAWEAEESGRRFQKDKMAEALDREEARQMEEIRKRSGLK